MHEREILQEVVLYGRAAEQHPPLGLQTHQGLIRLIFGIFQAMALVAQHEAHFVLVQYVRVQAKRLVTYNENGIHASVSFHETCELLVDVRFLAAVDSERANSIAQPLVNLVVPIFHQRAGSDDNRFVY